ncbi:hypothetical protein MIR68_011604 [Amoeboaphelidium protococcarum]|nr:hypothetical protein MIR68_011604 [Amoeboaphelidium protococcarum]
MESAGDQRQVQVSFQDTNVFIKVNKPVQVKNQNLLSRLKQSVIENFSYRQKVERQVLHNLYGAFLPGRLCVILGGSGAGKSVLLNVLSGNGAALQGTRVESDVYVNGELVKDGRFMNQISGFVQQDDLFQGTMTVYECLMMSAKLRRPDLNHEERERVVDRVLKSLLIGHIRDSPIGSAMKRGISGGERKRVSIGMELVANSPVLYLDEPTSGLDAFSSLLVIQLLRKLAEEGRTIIATIHAPSSQMLELMHDILILSDGKIIYHGPQESMQQYFASLGYDFPRYANPADHIFISVLRKSGENETMISSAERISQLNDAYLNSELAQRMKQLIENKPDGSITASMLKSTAPFDVQTRFLFSRTLLKVFRDPSYIITRIVTTTGLALFIALVYLNAGRTTAVPPQAVFQSLLGAMFLILINQTFVSFNSVLHVFGGEKPLFEREYGAGYYRIPSYFLSKVLIELPFQLIFPIILCFVVYWIIGFRDGFENFLLFTLFVTLIALFGTVLGLALGAIFKSVDSATVLGPLVILPLVIMGGFFVNLIIVPVWLRWIQWISPLQYAFTGMARSQLIGNSINGVPGEQQLEQIGALDRFSAGINVVFILAIIGVLVAIAYIGLVRSVYAAGIGRRDVVLRRKKILRADAKWQKAQQRTLNGGVQQPEMHQLDQYNVV